MKIKKTILDVIFIALSAVILIGLNEARLLEKNIGYALFPILTAYFLGQYSSKKYDMIKICSVLFALLMPFLTFSQDTGSENKESLTITIKPKFGFNIGADYSLAQNYSSVDSLRTYPSSIYNAPGFRLGVFGDIKIQQRFTLMPKAELSFNYATVQYNANTYKLDPLNLNFMLHGKINFTNRENKINPYCTFGPGLRLPLNGNDGGNYNTNSAWSADVALGLDFDLDWFYLSPEIRYSYGLTNIKAEDSWEKIRGSYVAFNLLFTGK